MRVAIFGGTFDPVHNAHLAVARAARDTFGLDRVLLIPAAIPPHKQDSHMAPYHHRLEMVRLAVTGELNIEASDMEAGAGKSFSILTIMRLKAALTPRDELLFIIGADAFAEIQTWHRWRDVVDSVAFIVVNRPGHVYSVPERADVRELTSILMDVSSSDIRTRLEKCEQPEALQPAVFEYIRRNSLYGWGSACETHPRTEVFPGPVSR